jgi:phosphotransferase system HPr-like phosphotransfer protein
VNGKSLLGIATLGATCGTSVDVETSGAGAVAAMVQLEQLFATGFGEGVA